MILFLRSLIKFCNGFSLAMLPLIAVQTHARNKRRSGARDE